MAGSSGNGKAGTLREKFAHNQAERERAIARLEGADWEEEVTETNITVEKGATVVVTTGKHQAMSKDQAEEITLTDPNIKRPSSVPPKVRALEHILAATNTWPKVVALAVIVAAVVALVLWGSPWVQKVLN